MQSRIRAILIFATTAAITLGFAAPAFAQQFPETGNVGDPDSALSASSYNITAGDHVLLYYQSYNESYDLEPGSGGAGTVLAPMSHVSSNFPVSTVPYGNGGYFCDNDEGSGCISWSYLGPWWAGSYDTGALNATTAYTFSVINNGGPTGYGTFWSSNSSSQTVQINVSPASCTSSPNACGQTNTGQIIGGVCNASTPANPVYYGQSCPLTSSANACGQTTTANTGTYDCSDTCTGTPPAAPSNASCPAPTVTCSVSPTSGTTATSYTWTAVPSSGVGPYTYVWGGTGGISGKTGISTAMTYASAATYTGSVTVTDSLGHSSASTACSNSAVVSAVPSASFTATPSCTIASGASSCTATASWTSAGVTSVNLTDNAGTTIVNKPVGAQSNSITIPYGGATFKIANATGGAVLASTAATATCTGTTGWDGTKCSAPTATCSVSPAVGTTATTYTWTAVPTGGVTPYTYAWTGTGSLTGHTGISTTITYTASTTPYTGSIKVTDSLGHSSAVTSCTNSATVNSPLAATCSGTPSAGTVNLTSFTWTAAPTGGVPPYTYSWTGSAPLASANSISRSVVYTSTGSKTAAVTVTDSAAGNTGSVACAAPLTVNPAGLPDYQAAGAPTISASAVTGVPVTFSGAVKNAGAVNATSTSQIRFQVDTGLTGSAWSGSPTNLDTAVGSVPILNSGVTDSTRTSPSWTPPSAGNYKVRLCADLPGNTIGEGANEGNNCGAELQVVVSDPAIAGSCGVSPTSGTTASTYTWSASGVSGGNGTYTYSWSGTDGLSGTGSSQTMFYSTAGTKTGTLTITSNGVSSSPISCASSATVTSCIPTFSASPSTITPGQNVTFTWSEPGACASSCRFSDQGTDVGISGTRTFAPPTPGSGTTQTYSITCPSTVPANTANATITYVLPTDSITATPRRVQLSATSTIAWTASNVTSCSITKNGSVWQASLPVSGGSVAGSQTDTISIPSTYVMTCSATVSGVTAISSATTTINTNPSFEAF